MVDFISLDVANKMLRLIKPIVHNISEQWTSVQSSLNSLEQIFSSTTDNIAIHLNVVVALLKKTTRNINKGLNELEELGCSLECIKEGVVDFPSILDDEKVMLCWKLGEDEVLYYHKRGETMQHRLLIKQVLE